MGLCKFAHNYQYKILLAPTAWKQYNDNIHMYPTRAYYTNQKVMPINY